MNMIIGAALGLSAAAAILRLGVAGDAHHAQKAGGGGCVSFDQELHKDSKTMDIRLTNSCSDEQACKISWTVTCDQGPGQAASEQSTLSPGESKTILASALQCDGTWTIGAPAWSCASAPHKAVP